METKFEPSDMLALIPKRLAISILALCEYTKQQERDGFILLVSKEGDGKSTLAQIIGFLSNMNGDRFELSNNVYTPEDFKRLVYESKGKTIIADEGTSLFLRADANSKWGRERVRILSQMRSRRHIVLVTLTESGLARRR